MSAPTARTDPDLRRPAPVWIAHLWTFTRIHLGTAAVTHVVGWDERDLNPSGQLKRSRSSFDAEDERRQTLAGRRKAPMAR